jgi:hypothetical protein
LPVSDAGWVPVTLPGDSSAYYVKSSAGDGPRQLYTRDPGTGLYKQVSKLVVPDSKGGWQTDAGLKGGVNDSPEARAEQRREARVRQTHASRQFLQAKDAARAAELKVLENSKKVSYLEIGIGQSERLVENKKHIVARREAAYTKAENNLTGASHQLTARRNQASQQPRNEVIQGWLATAQERYDAALHHRDRVVEQRSLARGSLELEQEDLRGQRLMLGAIKRNLSVAQAQLTYAQNALAEANVRLEQANRELRSAQGI